MKNVFFLEKMPFVAKNMVKLGKMPFFCKNASINEVFDRKNGIKNEVVF